MELIFAMGVSLVTERLLRRVDAVRCGRPPPVLCGELPLKTPGFPAELKTVRWQARLKVGHFLATITGGDRPESLGIERPGNEAHAAIAEQEMTAFIVSAVVVGI